MEDVIENVNEESSIAHQILGVSINNDGTYNVNVSGIASVEEVAFCMMVVIKCFEKDDIIPSNEMLALINKYLKDPQYEEVQS